MVNRRKKLSNCHPLSSSPTTKSAMQRIEDNSMLAFPVDVEANEPQIKQALRELCHIAWLRSAL